MLLIITDYREAYCSIFSLIKLFKTAHSWSLSKYRAGREEKKLQALLLTYCGEQFQLLLGRAATIALSQSMCGDKHTHVHHPKKKKKKKKAFIQEQKMFHQNH